MPVRSLFLTCLRSQKFVGAGFSAIKLGSGFNVREINWHICKELPEKSIETEISRSVMELWLNCWNSVRVTVSENKMIPNIKK